MVALNVRQVYLREVICGITENDLLHIQSKYISLASPIKMYLHMKINGNRKAAAKTTDKPQTICKHWG